MSNASNTSGTLAGILLGLAREGALALNRIPVMSAGKPEESAADLAKLVRELVIEKVIDEDDLSAQVGVQFVGEGGPRLCSICSGICDFGQRGDGPGWQDPETGIYTCSGDCTDLAASDAMASGTSPADHNDHLGDLSAEG